MAVAQIFSVPNIVREDVFEGAGMTTIKFGPAGRLYAAEKRGRVMVARRNPDGSYAKPNVVVDLRGSVEWKGESGLLGLALDPDFATNRHLYLFYTTADDQRLVRYTLDGGYEKVTGTPTVVLGGLPRTATVHKAGDIQFHPRDRDNVYVAIGDDTQPPLAQSLTTYNGKLLRVHKATGVGVASNPFATTNLDTVRSRIWSLGHRNPFRFAFHPNSPVADALYVSENGENTDRVSFVRMGANGNWRDGKDAGFLTPTDPKHKVMTQIAPASLVGIAIARGGPFADPAFPGSDVLVVANWGRAIHRYRLTGPNLDSVVPIAADKGKPLAAELASGGVHLAFGPDGALYTTICAPEESPFGQVFRLRFTGSR